MARCRREGGERFSSLLRVATMVSLGSYWRISCITSTRPCIAQQWIGNKPWGKKRRCSWHQSANLGADVATILQFEHKIQFFTSKEQYSENINHFILSALHIKVPLPCSWTSSQSDGWTNTDVQHSTTGALILGCRGLANRRTNPEMYWNQQQVD